MFYTVDMEVEIDVQDAFENLTQDEKKGLICNNMKYASDERLLTEIHDRGLKIAKDANYQELMNGLREMFFCRRNEGTRFPCRLFGLAAQCRY